VRRAAAAGALGAAAAAGGLAYYHGQVPTSQVYGATIHRRPEAGRRIALTYDDGPNPRCTAALMALLGEHGARATFFVVGRWAEREPGLVRELADGGHALGNHTWSHPVLALRSTGGVQDELARCREAVEGAGRSFATVGGEALMRPPWGRRRPGTLRAVRDAGYVPVLWSVTGWDWRARTDASTIAGHCLKAEGGDVVLLHDGAHTEPDGDRSRSLAATREVLERLGAEGYEFVTIPELMAA
jgi:peptidoglycan/xylan/chitin deacetylase (PgdA/CDA1 family)